MEMSRRRTRDILVVLVLLAAVACCVVLAWDFVWYRRDPFFMSEYSATSIWSTFRSP